MALNKPTGDMLNAGSDSAAQDLGTAAAAGTSTSYSRADHVHKLPSAADVGAVATSQLGALSGVATLDAGGKLTTAQIPALTTAQIAQITPAGIGAMATGERAGLATLTAGTLTTSQVAALTGDVTSTAGNPATVVGKIQGKSISNATPTTGQTLVWDGAQWAPATSNNPGGGGGANGLTYFLNQATAADAPVANIPGTPHQLGRSGEAGQTVLTTGTLAVDAWTLIAGFVSEAAPQDPATILIPAGLWDANVWCFGDANINAGTSIRAVAYIYSLAGGGTLTALGSPSSSQVINGTSAQYSLSVLVPQTAVLATDRIYIALEAFATGNNHTVTAQFGDSTPTHIHTSLPLVGGTGLWKNISGALQSPASLLFNADVDASAAIANSKIAGLAASATSDTTNASNIVSGTLRTDQLATISGLPTGAQGSGTLVPVVTVDNKGRVTALSTTAIVGGGTVTTSGATLTGNLSKFSSETAITKAVAGTDYQTALTTAQPLALTQGGTGAATAQAAISNLGVGMRMVEAQTIASVAGTMVGNVFTVTATGVFTGADGYTIIAGDIIAFTSQSAATQNGFWEVTTIGAVGVGAVFTRPSWYVGVVKNTMYMTRFGSTQGGYVMGAIGPLGTTEITVGTTSITAVQINYREKPALITSNTFTGPQVFRSNQAAANRNPFSFSSGSGLMTVPQAHAAEWDNSSMYLTSLVSLSGTWSSASTSVTVTTGSTSGLTVGAAVVSGITGTALTVASIQSLTTFTLSANPTNSGTAAAFTLASRDAVTTQNSFGTY